MGVPMIHMKPIPGCESKNRQLFTRSGMSVSARSSLSLAARGRDLLNDSDRRRRMVEAQRRQSIAGAAGRIVGFLEEKTAEHGL